MSSILGATRVVLVLLAATLVPCTGASGQDLPSPLKESARLKETLKDAIEKSLREPEGVQYVDFGPLKDRRRLKFEVQYHNGAGAPSVTRPTAGSAYLIRHPRQRLAKIPLISDAMMGCAQSPSLCAQMPDYINALQRAAGIDSAPFFDDVFPAARDEFAKLRVSKQWLASIQSSIMSATLFVSLHEMCHIVLKHPEVPARGSSTIRDLEGQADGCMLELLRLGDMSAAGGLVLMADSVFLEETFGNFTYTHPSAKCRSLAFMGIVRDWILKNRQILDARPPSPGRKVYDDAYLFGGPNLGAYQCEDYNRAIENGRAETRRLVDQNTYLNSNP